MTIIESVLLILVFVFLISIGLYIVIDTAKTNIDDHDNNPFS